MISTRQATAEDIGALRPLMEEWIAECNPDGLKFAPVADRLLQSFETMRVHPAGTTLVMLAEDQVIGCLGLVRHGWGACKTENFASENLWYVKTSHAGYSAHLVNAAKRWAASKGCDYLVFSTNRLSSERAGRGEEFLAAVGFKPLYRLHIAEVNHV